MATSPTFSNHGLDDESSLQLQSFLGVALLDIVYKHFDNLDVFPVLASYNQTQNPFTIPITNVALEEVKFHLALTPRGGLEDEICIKVLACFGSVNLETLPWQVHLTKHTCKQQQHSSINPTMQHYCKMTNYASN